MVRFSKISLTRFLPNIVLFCITFLLVGCSNSAPTPNTPESVERVPVYSIDQITGIWQSSRGFHYFSEEGTHEFGHSREGLDNRLQSEPEGDFWFEDGLHYHTSKLCETRGISTPGVYEVYLVQNDSLLFVAVDDECPVRKNWLAGYAEVNTEFIWTKSE
jgi:hypothetical protein